MTFLFFLCVFCVAVKPLSALNDGYLEGFDNESPKTGFGSATTCGLSEQGQLARLAIAVSLEPPYRVLGLPQKIAIGWGAMHPADRDLNFTKEANHPVDEQIGVFLRRLYKNFGVYHSDASLFDCGWEISEHICVGQYTAGKKCTDFDKDMYLFAQNGQRCVHAFTELNDYSDIVGAGSVNNEIDPESLFKIVKFKANASQTEVGMNGKIVAEYLNVKGTAGYRRAEDKSVSSCSEIISTGFSMGGIQAQIHRFDYGVISASGKMTSKCRYGGKDKPCKVVAFGAPGPFLRKETDVHLAPPELEADAEDSMFFVEDDVIAVFYNLLLKPLEVASFRTSLPDYSYLNIKAGWFPGMAFTQLGRNLTLSLNPPFKVRPQYFQQRIPRMEDPYSWLTSAAFQRRNNSYSHGPLGLTSHPACVQTTVAAGFIPVPGFNISCGHFCAECLLWTDWIDKEQGPPGEINLPMPPSAPLEIAFDSTLFTAFPVTLQETFTKGA